jgi:hypothetical protein
MPHNDLLAYRQTKPGHLECILDLSELYPSQSDRKDFKKKYTEFRNSDPCNRHIYRLNGNRLLFDSEQLVPTKTDDRPPLLLVFGNPASHSVKAGMFFAFKDGRESRFWNALLRRAGVLDFGSESPFPPEKLNRRRMKRMKELDYQSRFRIGLCVYISMPSSAGGPWSGVAGIRRLLGKKAMKELERFERERVLEAAEKFLNNRGTVVTFQKNAWEGLRSERNLTYGIDLAREGKLIGTLRGMSNVPLYGVPPTRLLGPCREVLKKFLVGECANRSKWK